MRKGKALVIGSNATRIAHGPEARHPFNLE